jgi:CheY-like chemotaxis protein
MTAREATMPKILILDDDEFLLDMYALKFKHEGYSVLAASSAEEALDFLGDDSDGSIVMALLDIVMPEMNGFEFVEEAQKRKIGKDTEFVFLSNLSQEADVIHAKKLGVKHFIVKANYTPSEVVEKVAEILKKTSK